MELKDAVRSIPDFPIEGVLFRDVTTLFKNKEAFKQLVDTLAAKFADKNIDLVVGPEARGFVMASALAYALNAGCVMLRKPGKLPCEVISEEYELEYGTDSLEVHVDAIKEGDKVLMVDDLLATGGTMKAGIRLVEKLGGEVVGLSFAIELSDLGGRKNLEGYNVEAAIVY